MNSVECHELSKSYSQGAISVPAIQELDLEVPPGGFVALAGPSGSGKTTLLNLIGGLDQPDTGEVLVEGHSLNEMSQGELSDLRLRRIGFIFQSYNLIPVLSALENVEFVMLLQGVDQASRRQRALAILEEVGLGGMENRRPAQLSGGQQQRVAVARAIVAEPALVLADEPTANLDSATGEGLLKIMTRLNQEKQITFIFSTHDRMVMDFARRLIILRDGRIAQDTEKEP